MTKTISSEFPQVQSANWIALPSTSPSTEANGHNRLIILSHLLPWTINKVAYSSNLQDRWIIKRRKGDSCLYAGILALAESEKDVIFVGCVEPNDSLTVDDKLYITRKLFNEKRAIPVFCDSSMFYGHESYCNNQLRTLFQYILRDHASLDPKEESFHWSSYVALNELVSKATSHIYNLGDAVWIHDYHLFLAPYMILKNHPSALIGFYLHSIFPSSEVFRCLPQRRQILKGVLGSSLIGFQNYSYARHFSSSCMRVLGLESTPTGIEYKGHLVSLGIFPIGVQSTKILQKCDSESLKQKIRNIQETFFGKKIVVGRDKANQIKGVLHKLLSFEKFLTDFPQWHGKVVLIQITSPDSSDDRKTELKVSEAVSRINGKFGSLESFPIHYFSQHFDQDHYLALLSSADVGMITPERDAMNTTAYEFILCQREKNSPLIISEFTGNAGLFNAALMVNPWDYSGTSAAIHDALCMTPGEKFIRQQQLFYYATRSSFSHWCRSFIDLLRNGSEGADQPIQTPVLEVEYFLQQYHNATRRLILLDYDGTLTPIRNTPSAALPSAELLKNLQAVTADSRNSIFVISGRDQAVLDEWLGSIPRLGLSAEHGCFIKFPGSKWMNFSSEIDLGWKDEILPIFEYYTERTPGSFIEHKRASLTWHYRLADPEFGSWQAKECQNHLENAVSSKLPVEVLIGKKNLEVRPISVNKGEVVKKLMQLETSCNFVFCAGDDRTDEDMFRILRKQERMHEFVITCTIGAEAKITQAQYHLDTPEALIELLGKMTDVTKIEEM